MESTKIGDHEGPRVPYLICRQNTSLCALPLATVAETMRPLPIEPLAHAPPFVLGVSIIRGAPVPVVDTALLLGAAASAPPKRMITLKVDNRAIALAVDGVIGLHSLSIDALGEIPPLLGQADTGTIAAISTLDAQLLLVLQSARIVPESVWTSMDSAQ
jgi:purine-binding chemotaxis protein CheW